MNFHDSIRKIVAGISEHCISITIEGRLFNYIQLFLIIFFISILLLDMYIPETEKTRTVIFESTQQKQYSTKKVSHIPKGKEKEEAEKIAFKDDTLTEEDVKQHYYHYIASKIEACKFYPPEEINKAHEGTTVLELILHRSGTVKKVRILKQTIFTPLNDAAIMSIRRAIPFKPFPEKIKDETLTIQLTIRFSIQ